MVRACATVSQPAVLLWLQDYMDSSDTSSTLASGNFLGIINVLMQLRKVPLFFIRIIIRCPVSWLICMHFPCLLCHDAYAHRELWGAATARSRLTPSNRSKASKQSFSVCHGCLAGTLKTGGCPPKHMQVCNHPDLFEGRPIVSAFDMAPGLVWHLPSLAARATERDVWGDPGLDRLLLLPAARQGMSAWEAQAVKVRWT